MKTLALLFLSSSLELFAQVSNYTFRVIPKTDLSATGTVQWIDKQTTPHYVGFQAPSSVSANTIWELPSADAAGCFQSDGALHMSLTTCGAASVINGFFVTNKTAVGPPVTSMGLQVWYDPSSHTTTMASYNNANSLSPMIIGASTISGLGNEINFSSTVQFEAYQKYNISGVMQWSLTASASNILTWKDASANPTLQLNAGGTSFLGPTGNYLNAPTVLASPPTCVGWTGTNCGGGSPGLVVGGVFPGTQTADIFMVVDKFFGPTRYLWVDAAGGTHIANCVAGCGTSQWINGASSSIHYDAGNVGINTTTTAPSERLVVNGDIGMDGNIKFRLGGVTQWSVGASASNIVTWRDASANTTLQLNAGGTSFLGPTGNYLNAPTVLASPPTCVGWVGTNCGGGSPGLVVGGVFPGTQTADIFEVVDKFFGPTRYLWVDASGGTHIANCVAGCSGGAATVEVYIRAKADCGMAVDGTTDDSTALMNCINTVVPATGGHIIVGPGVSKIGGATSVIITKNNVTIEGSGGEASGDGEPSSIKTSTQFLCTTTPCFTFQGATFLGSPYNQNVIFGARMTNLSLNGNGTSGNLIKTIDMWNSKFDNVAFLNHASDYGMIITSDVNQAACSSRQIVFDHVTIGSPNNLQPLTSGIRFGELSGGHEVCSMLISNLITEVSEAPGTHGLFFDNADSIEGSNIHLNGSGGTICCNSTNASANITIVSDSGGNNPVVTVLGGFVHNMPVTGLDDGLFILNGCDGSVSALSCSGVAVPQITGQVVGHATSSTQIQLTGITGLIPSHTYNGWLIAGTSFAANNTLDIQLSSVYTLNNAYASSNAHNIVFTGWNWYERCGSGTGCTYNSPYARTSPRIASVDIMGSSRIGDTVITATDFSNNVSIGDRAAALLVQPPFANFAGHIHATTNATQGVGTKSVAFADGYFRNNVSSRQYEIYNHTATDLNGGFDSIISEIVTSPSRDIMYLQDAVGNPMLALRRTVASTTVNQAVFDMNVFPLVNSNGTTTGYDIGGSSNQWRDIYWAGKLVQSGITRLDVAGNLTVTSCTGCGSGSGVTNGYFVTGSSTVNPPTTVQGFQAYYTTSDHAMHMKTYDGASNLTGLVNDGFIQVNGNVLPLTDVTSDIGASLNRWRNIRSGNAYIGLTPLNTPSDAFLQVAQNTSTVVDVDSYSNGIGTIAFRSSNGSYLSPSAIGNAQAVGSVSGGGFDGSAWVNATSSLNTAAARMSFVTNEAWSSTRHGMDIWLEATGTGGGIRQAVAKVIGPSSGGLHGGIVPVIDNNGDIGSFVANTSASVWAKGMFYQTDTRLVNIHDSSPFNAFQGSGGTSFCCMSIDAAVNPIATYMRFVDSTGTPMLQLIRNSGGTVDVTQFNLTPVPPSDGGLDIGKSSNRFATLWSTTVRTGFAPLSGENTIAPSMIVDTGTTTMVLDSINNGFAGIPSLIMRKANGIYGSGLSAVNSGDIIGLMGARGYNGSGWTGSTAAYIDFVASEPWGFFNNGTEVRLATTQNGQTTNGTRWIIQNNGHLVPNVSNSYNIGAPGTVVANGYFQNIVVGSCTGCGGGGSGIISLNGNGGPAVVLNGTNPININNASANNIVISCPNCANLSSNNFWSNNNDFGSTTTHTGLATFNGGTATNIANVTNALEIQGTIIVDSTRSLNSITAFNNVNVGSGGNFYLRTFGGGPNCSGVNNGWVGVDISNSRLWVCISGVARFAVLN